MFQEEGNETNPKNSGNDNNDNTTMVVSDSIAKATSLLFEKWNDNYLVVTVEGDISFYRQTNEKTLVLLSRISSFTSAE